MVEVSKKDNGFLFNNQFFFASEGTNTTDQEGVITLKTNIWKDMNYQVSIQDTIEYPWVYNFDDIHVVCEHDPKTDLLNFVVKTPKIGFAIVQDTNAIDGDNYEDIKDVFVINELQLNKFLKLDIDTNTVDLESIS